VTEVIAHLSGCRYATNGFITVVPDATAFDIH
jgi:hypothetical protein